MAYSLRDAPAKVIIDLINTDNPTLNLLASQITMGVPAVETGAKNTSLVLTAVNGGPYLGTRPVFYNRLDLAAVVATKSGRIEKSAEVTSIATAVAAINAVYKINLTTDDYTASAFPTWENVPNEEHTITLTAKADSLVYLGAATLTLYLPQVNLADAIVTNNLNGLNYDPDAA